jgi:hypothetical protein
MDDLTQAYRQDKELKELYAKKEALEAQLKKDITDRRRTIAKDLGELVKDVGELVCDKHTGPFMVLPQAAKYTLYACRGCEESDTLERPTEAYECPGCGIVKGEPQKRPFSSSKESWRSLAGREGTAYHCRVCDEKIGEIVTRLS